MPVSQQDWARERREEHRRETVWEPWGRDAGYPDPAEGREEAEDPVQWDETEDEKDARIGSKVGSGRVVRFPGR